MSEALNELGDSELIKRINDEVGVDLAAERNTYTRAVALGEMLVLLRNRRNDKRGWQEYLKEKCPKLAYETATLYIRLHEKQDEIIAAAKAQSVTVTDLTVRLARKLIAGKGKGKTKPKPAPAGGVEPGEIKASSPSTAPDVIIGAISAEEIFDILKPDNEKLQKLYGLLRDHVMRSPVRRPPAAA
jgi:hypothetical protein